MSSPMFTAYNRPNHKQVSIQDPFWGAQMQKIRTVTVWDIIHKFENDYGEGIMKNFEDVAQGLTGTGHHVGPQWYDGLIYEVIRGASDLLDGSCDEKLVEKLDEFIDQHEKDEENQDEQIMDILNYLTDWLINHILHVDGQIPKEA